MEKTSITREATFSAQGDSRFSSKPPPGAMWVCHSSSMRSLDGQITRVAAADHCVLLTGESGTGKTTVARIIHQRSPRGHARFVDINSAALPDHLVESELFGFERGAFTGAMGRKQGLLEVADQGTLLLDEIGDLKLELQAKLLKAIDDRKIRRLGGIRDIYCNVRLVAATSRNLQRMVADGSFREDLYYRLAVLQLNVPPLRERQQDIGELVYRQLTLEQAKIGRAEEFELDDRALTELSRYSWPGNIRQLQNVIARLACYADGKMISADAVRAELGQFKHLDADTIILPESCRALFGGESLTEFTSRVRGAVIDAVKVREQGSMSRVAQRLNAGRSSLARIQQRINATRRSANGHGSPSPSETPFNWSHSETQ